MHSSLDERRYLIPFRASLLPQIFTETLVIGGGVAGLRAGIAAAERGDVVILAKGRLEVSNTDWAQGGVAVVMDSADSVEEHVRDTLGAGGGLNDEPVVREVAERGPERVQELLDWGLRADVDESGAINLAREGGHSRRRILHADGDATGRELMRVLAARARRTAGIRIFESCFALDLLTPSPEAGSPCLGAITHHPRFGLQIIWAKSTILASGGLGVVWRETTNTALSTGDGLAMAYRAGASLADMAFMQFHPTTLYVAGSSRSLISEAVRGEGATLVDRSGNRFMADAHPMAELAPRDVVSRAIVRHLGRAGDTKVYLDARGVKDFERRFPGIAAKLRSFEIDARRELIPVRPAAHYMIGGVRTDLDGRTNVPGLFAAGEAACSGLHGANRLASNSLLEGLALGERAGRAAAEAASGGSVLDDAGGAPLQIISDIPLSERGELDLADVRSSLRSAMWRNVGVDRCGGKLADVVEMIDFWARYTLDKIFDEPAGWETQNMLLLGALVARSALWRAETRGCHGRSDHPEASDAFRAHDLLRRGATEIEVEAVQEGVSV